MEELLKKYLQKKFDWEYIDIGRYDIEGAICTVNYYTDDSYHYKEQTNINIWEMLVFLNAA